MALNKFMHPRNIYKTRKPDFKALSEKYDYFKEKVTENTSGKVILDFKDPAALRALTRALLEDDFGLVVTLPLDRLIPTVPQRLNYILWLEDIIGKENGAKGIDIGTGSSCIYPLLGCRLNQWQFVASEIDDQNLYFATKNVANNKMEDKISRMLISMCSCAPGVLHVDQFSIVRVGLSSNSFRPRVIDFTRILVKKVTEETLLLGLIDERETYDFCMCNPPFYSDHLEAQGITSTRNDDRSESSSVSTASEAESIAWGGEVKFVSQMIEESLLLKKKVRVYTSLLGKKTSLPLLKDILQKKKVPKFGSTEFCQGRTMRWGIAWTFDETVDFPKSSFKEQKNAKPPLQFEIPRSSAEIVGDYTVQSYSWFLIKQLEELKLHFYTKHKGKFYSCFIVQAKENTWSHQRRKRRKHNREMNESHLNEQESEKKETNGNKRTATDQDVEYNTTKKIKLENSDQSRNEISDTGGKSENECETIETGKDGNNEAGVKKEESSIITDNASDKTAEDEAKSNVSVTDISNIAIVKEKSELVLDSGNDKSEVDSKTDEVNKHDKESPNTLVRKDVIAQFWKEKMENSDSSSGKKKDKSFYEVLEPFKEEEECLLLSKIVIRKEEGVISFSLTYLSGNREAMHQIMQYFKNKLCLNV